ncbi:MAG: hypothetical protein D3925_00910 [Candidatus Electrothrix sp. AR5]|nr:hypothetical protein [Candidatus Electrothrix sp. AR5]
MGDQIAGSASEINTYLAIWGAVAPLVAAAVSAWWSRRNEIQNRKLNQEHENVVEERRIKMQNIQRKLEINEIEIKALHDAVISFIEGAATIHRVKIQTAGGVMTENEYLEQAVKGGLEVPFNNLFLSCPSQEVINCAKELQSFASGTPLNDYEGDNGIEKGKIFRSLKSNLLREAREYIKQERKDRNDILK